MTLITLITRSKYLKVHTWKSGNAKAWKLISVCLGMYGESQLPDPGLCADWLVGSNRLKHFHFQIYVIGKKFSSLFSWKRFEVKLFSIATTCFFSPDNLPCNRGWKWRLMHMDNTAGGGAVLNSPQLWNVSRIKINQYCSSTSNVLYDSLI